MTKTSGFAAGMSWDHIADLHLLVLVSRQFTIPRVTALLRQFAAANTTGNSYASEKINDVRVWFDELAKGERGHFTAEKARSNLHSAIAKLRMIIDPDGERLRLPG